MVVKEDTGYYSAVEISTDMMCCNMININCNTAVCYIASIKVPES